MEIREDLTDGRRHIHLALFDFGEAFAELGE